MLACAGVNEGTMMIKLTLLVAALMLPSVAEAACGKASWYGPGFHGRQTASGQKFNQNAMTAAHKTLPFGTKLRVKYGKRSVVVVINDRGPFVGDRVLDLSKGAAQKLGLIPAGVGKVCWERV
jgi:rare lipoprotein A